MYVCMYIYMYIYIYTHTHTYIHSQFTCFTSTLVQILTDVDWQRTCCR